MPRLIILSNPRSGSTYLCELLNSHPEVHIAEELLNDEEDIQGDPVVHLENELSTYSKTYVGFKVFPEQIFDRGLDFASLVGEIGATHVIVLWRQGILETLTSRRIADKTGVWYSTDKSTNLETVVIDPKELTQYTEATIRDWHKIGDQWPVGVVPIFVKFEDLITNPVDQIKHVLSRLSCPLDKFAINSPSKRQNPGKLSEKVTNYDKLCQEMRDKELNVEEILETKIQTQLPMPPDLLEYAPDREPFMPPGGWRYRVAEPFMPSNLKQNVYDAVESSSVSSAGFWPRLMSTKLKELFQVPVAQPCSNGFTALMLAMQSVNITKGDEVILPSMTMVAVANAVHFLGAQPVFVDSCKGDYNPSWEDIEKGSTDKTKAVIVTHTYGVPTPNMEMITVQCAKRGWWLIEDISECVGVKTKCEDGTQKLLGTFGHFACASMYVNKMVHAGDGGFVIAKDPKFAIRLTSLVNHGFTPSFHFVHFEPALNAKINGLGAAMACGCIDDIQFVMDHRAQIARLYRQALAPLPIKLMGHCGPQDTPWVFGIECDSKSQRSQLRSFLAERGIESRDYFFPLHLQPAFYVKSHVQHLPICEQLGSTGFYLPTHSNLKTTDVNYISSCMQQFFQPADSQALVISKPSVQKNSAVQVQPGSFRLEVREFNDSGSLSQIKFRGHVYIQAVKIGLEAEEIIVHERWDEKTLLIQEMKDCIQAADQLKMKANMELYFEPYLNYFQSQESFEQAQVKPWLHVDLATKDALQAQEIPTTTDPETLQLLLWLIEETRPENIWEIGCWMGHASYRMASLAQSLGIRLMIFACDAFKWQDWMSSIVQPEIAMLPGHSFLKSFQNYTHHVSKFIQPVDWPYDISQLPTILHNQRPKLVFLDITQEEEEIEVIWQMILPNLIANKTIIVFNGLSHKSIPFFSRHAAQLVGVAKPSTIAKAFRFVSNPKGQENDPDTVLGKLPKRLNFQSDPGWTHHHKNLFCSSIALLREQFHSDTAPILFFPAIEERMCDEPEIFLSNPWIGIVHSVADYPELFYTPDLRRLCSPKYGKMMKNCKGLFTYTQFQADFLQQNLALENKFPIQPLKYPVEGVGNDGDSLVPQLWKSGKEIDLIFVGSFARDFQLFFNAKVPVNMRKVLVAGDEIIKMAAARAPSDVAILDRLTSEEYEEILYKSLVFLSLKYDGAANTLTLECIARNIPIVSPDLSSCVEYLGPDYPLLYDPNSPNLDQLITLENIEKAISYLKSMDKTHLSTKTFIENFQSGAVLVLVPPMTMPENDLHLNSKNITLFSKYDLTICICSYKRTQHLSKILKSFWEDQDFEGSFQIIVWNNNSSRTGNVHQICKNYVNQSNSKKSLELINSTENYFCSVRFAMPALMKSDCLLICDDDIIPGSNFVTFFTSAHYKNPKDVLCVRGHVFSPHDLQVQDPARIWVEYDSLRFKNDDDPEQFIHFVHADACLIPKGALREMSSVEMPDYTFTLVDDYWMSFVLNHRFGRKLRKLSVAGLPENPINRTDDSDQVGLALHTRPEVQDARLRLYVHHMLQGWPEFQESLQLYPVDEVALKTKKSNFWDKAQLGYNISSQVSPGDVQDLGKMNIKSVRIGAVGIGEKTEFDLCGFLNDPEEQLSQLAKTVDLLKEQGIDVILTLERRLVTPDTWKLIASKFGRYPNVVGYDLINEPFTEAEEKLHWTEFDKSNDPTGLSILFDKYTELIKSIREVDLVTPIIIESSYWGRIHSITKLPIKELQKVDSNLITSFHFYESMSLTQRRRNKGRYTFPCAVPLYDDIPFSEVITWDEDYIRQKFTEAKSWAEENGVRIFLGEFGICRDIGGAEGYLRAVINACKGLGISGYVFSFRDADWEAMDYELGEDMLDCQRHGSWQENRLMTVVLEGASNFKIL